MSLRVAVQMDPMDSINIAGDSSFALMLSAQDRGMEVWHYDVASLAYETGEGPGARITAHAAPVKVQRVEGDHYTIGERRRIDLAPLVDGCGADQRRRSRRLLIGWKATPTWASQ